LVPVVADRLAKVGIVGPVQGTHGRHRANGVE
jgi:hypothetical protein